MGFEKRCLLVSVICIGFAFSKRWRFRKIFGFRCSARDYDRFLCGVLRTGSFLLPQLNITPYVKVQGYEGGEAEHEERAILLAIYSLVN
jgi:hypothetical protein